MDNIIWKAITKSGQMICQNQNDKYNNFINYDHSQWLCFTLFNKSNNANYGIDLVKGCFLFNGLTFQPAVQNGVYDIPCVPNGVFNFGKTLFWYNQFMSQLNTNNTQNKLLNVYAGYTVQLNHDACINNKIGKLKLARPCLKINAQNNVVSFSTSYLFQYVDQNGKSIKVQG